MDSTRSSGSATAASALAAEAIADSRFPGPFEVGSYAAQLRRRLQEFARVQLAGEVWGFRSSRVRVYFELRDARGALPCSMWRDDFERLAVTLADGMRVVVGGGCDYYPGSAASSPTFSFAVTELRLAGEGDLLVQLERLRRRLDAEGLFEPQKRLPLAALPRTIGVVTGESGKARDDVLAGLRRRGWSGRLVWAFVPVQDRHAAPRIAAALRELAATPEVEVVIVARGGGSLADLYAFCDEALCRTVALLRVPVISSVGHHTDRTLIDDVAAVSLLDARPTPPRPRSRSTAPPRAGRWPRRAGACATTADARSWREPGRWPRSRGPRPSTSRATAVACTSCCGSCAPPPAASSDAGRSDVTRHATTLERTAARAAERRPRPPRRVSWSAWRMALAAHDPQRTMARGYALVQDRAGVPLGSAAAARNARELTLRFHDGAVAAEVAGEKETE